MAAPVLEMRHITQTFPGVVALSDVSFTLEAGEIHALVGENGAGKSTLMKVLTGVNRPDAGEIQLAGECFTHLGIQQAKALGVNMIYQELNLVPGLRVYENIFLGHELTKNGKLDRAAMKERAAELIATLGIRLDVNETVQNLTMAYRQMVEIARALRSTPKVLVMDEPTAPLTGEEVGILFKTIRVLKGQGVSVVYISHRMEEIFELCDRCTVFRDGKCIATKRVEDTDMDELIRLMVGRELAEQYPPRVAVPPNAPVLLEVKGLTNGKLKGVSLGVKAGEILGIGGLVGAGRTEVLRALFGADRYSGEICKNGRPIAVHTPADAIRQGIVLVTEDRKGQGLLLNQSLADNIVLPVLAGRMKGFVLDRRGISGQVDESIRRLSIKTPGQKQRIAFLSGGNQQKAIIARWLLTNADVILFDEPTRGIDVGAKYDIYGLMNELKQNGKSVVMVSSDMPELMGISDRILVMAAGRITGELKTPAEFDGEAILRRAANIAPGA